MSAPRSKRLAGPVGLPAVGTALLLYTAPADRVALVKSVRCTNTTGNGRRWRLYVGAVGVTQTVLEVSVAATSTFVDTDTDPIVLAPGEVLRAECLTAAAALNDLVVTLSGAELVA